MPSPAETIRSANKGITTLVERDLSAFWSSLNLSKPESARDALLEYTPRLVAQYGDIAATVSADWYDTLRATSGAHGSFSAILADVVLDEMVVSQVRFGASHLFTDTPTNTLDFLTGALTKYALRPGRDTISTSASRDPSASGWRRDVRAGACEFCHMLASRGGVYKEATAHFKSHGHCHCVAVPSWDKSAPEVDSAAYIASKRPPQPQTGGLNAMSEEQVRHQISITEGLKPSDWRTQQLARLRAQLAQVA